MFFTINLVIHFERQEKLLLIEVMYTRSFFLLHSQSSVALNTLVFFNAKSNQIEPTGKTNGIGFTHVLWGSLPSSVQMIMDIADESRGLICLPLFTTFVRTLEVH